MNASVIIDMTFTIMMILLYDTDYACIWYFKTAEHSNFYAILK